MSRRFVYTALFSFLLLANLKAQISPGPLSKSHADLEGMSNCTQCHTIGQKVSNDKCMSCHDEIKIRMDQRSGYHASREVRGQDCASCHSDHHGRNFDMVHMDETAFDHDLTGYELEGAHGKIDCRECHQPDYISEWELKQRTNTFLGLEQKCLSCHEDYHQKTLSTDCASCHDSEAFAPASNFDHNDADFVLRGKHQDVECIECHQEEIRNGKEFQRFTAISFTNCNSCHDDAHAAQLGTDCKSCHVEQSFTAQSGLRRFNHGKTEFPLLGKHQQVNCADCHNLTNTTPLNVFQDRTGVGTQECATCHQDVHSGKFGTNCAECHNENSFRISGSLDHFNHQLTGFSLEGKHQLVDCRECHQSGFLEPLPHQSCTDCHEDYHRGELLAGGRVQDCASCHSVEGFETSLYTIGDHNVSQFPLAGAHAATPCFECHLQAGQWQFRNIGERCIDCHDNVHGNDIDPKFYPNQACDQCHRSTNWQDSQFDHQLTAFELKGAHAQQACSACHLPDDEHKSGKFKGLDDRCSACHADNHYQQFARNEQTDCARCHDSEHWEIENFNHNRTAFRLTGEHVSVDCVGCHQPIEVEGNTFIQYKFKSFECVVCHQ